MVLMIMTRGGAAAYWENDSLRLQVVGIFLAGLVSCSLLSALAQSKADERERWVLTWGALGQSRALILVMVLWSVILTQRFHDQGAIPVVYFYLILGSLFIVQLVAHFCGILPGSWAARHHAQG